MRTWKIALACIALISASMFVLAHHGSSRTDITAPAAMLSGSQQSTPAERAADGAKPDNYGWGPVHTTDW
jgi:hypothetical protein